MDTGSRKVEGYNHNWISPSWAKVAEIGGLWPLLDWRYLHRNDFVIEYYAVHFSKVVPLIIITLSSFLRQCIWGELLCVSVIIIMCICVCMLCLWVNVCEWVCVCVYMCVYMCVPAHVCVCVRAYAPEHVRTGYVCTHVCVVCVHNYLSFTNISELHQ